jgi:hypothetical protein
MARKDEAGQYLLEGLTPQEIQNRMRIGLNSICQYLCTLVGEGKLLRSDIAFSVAERHLIEDLIRNGAHPGDVDVKLSKQGHKIDREVISLYLLTRDPRPDMFALICKIEVLLHGLVKKTLEVGYGDRWWRKGIPEPTRKKCQLRKEEDMTPLDEPYHYTNFIDLKSIIETDWRLFSIALPKALATNKPNTLQRLQRVNAIRNQIMHPVKEISGYENDYRFARKFLADFDHQLWRVSDVQPVQEL